MSDTNNSSKIDEAQKKPPTKREEYFTNLKNYVLATFWSGINLLLWFVFSLIIIYACKLSQANVLPTDINCFPYTRENHKPEDIQTNIFTNLPFSSPRKSMKLSFYPGNSLIDETLKFFRDYKEDVKSSFLGNYFYTILESLFMKNYSYYNYMLSFLNALPEFLLVIFGPFLGLIIFIIGVLLNIFYFSWYWFSNLGWMWKKNGNIKISPDGTTEYSDPPVKWVDVRWNVLKDGQPDPEKSEWFACVLGFALIVLFINIFMILFAAQGVLIFSTIFSIFSIITFFMYSMKLDGKDASFTDLFPYFFRYNKLIIMTIFAIYIVTNAYTYLGSVSAVFALFTMFLIYYLKIIEMFVPINEEEDTRTSPLVSNKQATKEACEIPKTSKSNAVGGNLNGATIIRPVTQPIAQPVTQSGGSLYEKYNQLGGEKLIRKLKDFNKKYAQFLL